MSTAIYELYDSKIIYDIRNPNFNFDVNKVKEGFSDALIKMSKQLKKFIAEHTSPFESDLLFSCQADMYQKFKEIFKRSLFDKTPFRQVGYLLWTIFRESESLMTLCDLDVECLYIRIELYCWGKAIFPDNVDVHRIELLDYFVLHRAIFDNRLSYIRKLLTHQA